MILVIFEIFTKWNKNQMIYCIWNTKKLKHLKHALKLWEEKECFYYVVLSTFLLITITVGSLLQCAMSGALQQWYRLFAACVFCFSSIQSCFFCVIGVTYCLTSLTSSGSRFYPSFKTQSFRSPICKWRIGQ